MPTVPDRTIAISSFPPAPAALDARALERVAGELAEAARRGMPIRPLAGRQLAIIYADDRELAEAVEAAAVQVGARPALIPVSDARLADPQQAPHTLAVLRRLYDGMVCVNLPPELCERLSREAGLAVCTLRCQGEPGAVVDESRTWRIQAALVRAQ
jgi:hypothetical protein